MPSDYSSPLLPTRSVPSFASDPRYLEELRARKLREMQSRQPTPSTASPSFHSRNAMSSAEGPMLDGMQASELFYDRPAPQLRSARDISAEGPMLDGMRASELIRQPAASTGRANPSAEGPLLDDMLAAELFKRAQEYEATVGGARANQAFQQGLGVPMDAFQTFKNVNRRPEARPFQQGLGLPADDMRAILERQEMVRRMESQGYTR